VEHLTADVDRLLVAAGAVTRPASIELAVTAAVERLGTIDVLVNNAGFGTLGAIEEVSDPAARAAFDVNVFGLLNATRAVLPTMRRQRSGRILNLSSMTGQVSGPGLGIYAATKHAVEAISEALRHEVAPLGIRVTAIEPGAFRTDFFDGSSLATTDTPIDDYAESVGVIRTIVEKRNHTQPGDPQKAASIIVDLASVQDPPARVPLGADAIERIEASLTDRLAELQAWRAVAMSTSFDS
jgi:NAD(P)-dependent dehydrogenase (short-subunit alcohol dehydrogenase family)